MAPDPLHGSNCPADAEFVAAVVRDPAGAEPIAELASILPEQIEFRTYASSASAVAAAARPVPSCIVREWTAAEPEPPLLREVEARNLVTAVVLVFDEARARHVVAASRHRALQLVPGWLGPRRLRPAVRRGLRRSRRVLELRLRIAALTASFSSLTAREWQVLEFVRVGLSSKAIARELKLSKRTIDSHRHSLLRKTNASSLVELAHRSSELSLERCRERALTAGTWRPRSGEVPFSNASARPEWSLFDLSFTRPVGF